MITRHDECIPSTSPSARIGHVHLNVADLERSTAFYRDMLGFQITAYGPAVGLPVVFMALGDYHHHLALNTWSSACGASPPEHSRLNHFALVYPDECDLARAVRRLFDHGYPIDSAEDHGATVSVYLRDPDGIGIELYYDRPREAWFDTNGQPVLKADSFDPRDLLAAVPTIA